MQRNHYQSEILEVLHEMAEDLHKIEAISDEKMAEYDRDCLAQRPKQAPNVHSSQSAAQISISAKHKP